MRLFFFLPLSEDVFIDFEREREREKHRCERETLIGCLLIARMLPDWGLDLQAGCVPRLGIPPGTFWCVGQCSNQLSHLARAPTRLFWSPLSYLILKSAWRTLKKPQNIGVDVPAALTWNMNATAVSAKGRRCLRSCLFFTLMRDRETVSQIRLRMLLLLSFFCFFWARFFFFFLSSFNWI